MSRLHALIFNNDGNWMITDLGSSKGIRDEKGEVANAQLVDGAWIALGPAFVWFRDERPESARGSGGTRHISHEKARSRAVLLVTHSENTSLAFGLDERRMVSIGESATCDITIEDAGLEPLELVLFRVGSKWHAVSVSKERIETSEDGEVHQCSALAPGTLLRIGQLNLSLLEVRVLPRVERASSSELGHVGLDDELSIDSIDLEAAARSGNSGGPKRPNSR